MTEPADHETLESSLREALRHLRRHGCAGSPSSPAIDRFVAGGEDAARRLETALAGAGEEDIAPLVYLAGRLQESSLAGAVADTALRRPAPLLAKRQAVSALRAMGVTIPFEVEEALALATGFVVAPSAESFARVEKLPEAWRLPTLREWVSRGRLDAGLLAQALRIVAELDEAIIEALGRTADPEAVPPLQRIAQGEDKSLRKAARRALHRLRSDGVEVDVAEPSSGGFSLALSPDAARESRAYVTGVDGSGRNILWLLTPSEAGGERLLEAVLDDTTGLRKAEVLAITRSGFREHLQRLRSDGTVLVVQLEPAQAVQMLLEAERLSERADSDLPAAYDSWKRRHAAALFTVFADSDGAAPTDNGGATAEVDADLLEASAELFALPCFSGWVIVGAGAEEAAQAVRDAETSRLALDESQRRQQVDAAMQRAAELLDDKRRALYGRRLQRMAMLLQRSKKPREAAIARAAAAALETVQDLYADHPFARALIQRSVLLAYQQIRERPQDGPAESRIIRP